MGPEPRSRADQGHSEANPQGEEPRARPEPKVKSFEISKRLIVEAWEKSGPITGRRAWTRSASAPIPDPEAASPRVVGVDDFAIRRGQHYGTLPIDCETGAPLDLIEGRDAQPLADRLAAHPGVEVICRDRSGAYADGARTGAPDAVQVADRFHLWQNLAKAVEKCVAAHRACLAEPALPAAKRCRAPGGGCAARSVREVRRARPAQARAGPRAARRGGAGCGRSPATWGWGLRTVQRYDRAATWQELAESRSDGAPQQARPVQALPRPARRRGHGSFTRLFHEVKELGYDGSYSVVRNYLDKVRPAKAPLGEAPPTVRDVTNWLCHCPDTLTEDERPRLKAILDRCPEIQAASGQVRAFATMITDLTGQDLPQWMAAAREAGLPGISSFAKGLEQDLDAVTQGLTTNWSSGPVEGRVNHIR